MLNKISISILGVMSVLLISHVSFGQTSTTSTTVEKTVETKTPKSMPKETTVTTTTTQTVPPPTPPPTKVIQTTSVTRKVYDEDMLKKMSDTLCTNGFKAYVGSDKKNVCLNKAVAPDFAYTCVWDKDGTAAYAPTVQGPCSLDLTEHKGSVIIKKETYEDDPPLAYGTEAQCCYRAASGPATVIMK